MANLKITINGVLMDGHEVTFKAPCDCTYIDKLDVHYVENLVSKNKLFTMKDSHGNTLAGLGNLFEAGAYVHVILNTKDGAAYIQNADTNGYLEGKFSALWREINAINAASPYKVIIDDEKQTIDFIDRESSGGGESGGGSGGSTGGGGVGIFDITIEEV